MYRHNKGNKLAYSSKSTSSVFKNLACSVAGTALMMLRRPRFLREDTSFEMIFFSSESSCDDSDVDGDS